MLSDLFEAWEAKTWRECLSAHEKDRCIPHLLKRGHAAIACRRIPLPASGRGNGTQADVVPVSCRSRVPAPVCTHLPAQTIGCLFRRSGRLFSCLWLWPSQPRKSHSCCCQKWICTAGHPLRIHNRSPVGQNTARGHNRSYMPWSKRDVRQGL